MKKILTSILFFVALIMSAQEVPTSFPRKFLIEHFTDETCKYCPDGMYCIVNYTKTSTTPHIWVSHHDVDEYNIPESTKLKLANGVEGTPNIALNRTKITGTTIAFHPSFLDEDVMKELIADKFDTTADASVVINHTYDATTRNLNITVSGQVANTEVTKYLLTVLIKENGLIGPQKDYFNAWNTTYGYKEFLHPCIVREVLSADALGDVVAIENQTYSQSYTFTLPDNWVAENCCIVAYITPTSKKPVINAEEVPVVEGTDGGACYLPFAITEAKDPTNVTKLKFDSIALSKPSEEKLLLQLVARSTTRSNKGPVLMVVSLEFNTTDTVVPIQTLDIKDGNELNTFTAGQVDLETQTFSGSQMAYHLAADMEQLLYRWRIRSGQVTMDEKGGFVATGKICTGNNFSITCTLPEEETAVKDIVFDQAHIEKLMRNGQFIIRIDEVEYDLQGREIK